MSGKTIDVLKYKGDKQSRVNFFYYSLSLKGASCQELQEAIQKKKEHILKIERYIENVPKIEGNIQAREEYEKILIADLNETNARIARREAKGKPAPHSHERKIKFESKLQRTKDLIIGYKQELEEVKKKVEYWKEVLPYEKGVLHRLERELDKTSTLAPPATKINRLVTLHQRGP